MRRLRTAGARWWWTPWLLAAAVLWLAVPLRSQAQPDALYSSATGHRMTDQSGFLSYWRANGGERLLGLPVTEEVAENGLTAQYFERGRLERHPELEGAPLLLGLIGSEYAQATWRSFEPADRTSLPAEASFFELTGHSLSAPFRDFWQANGGVAQLGYPISEPLWEFTPEGQVQVQYFERARLEHHPLASNTPDEIRVSDLGRALAALHGHDLAPLANQGFETYGSAQAVAPVSADQFMAQAVSADALLAAQAPAPAVEAAAAPIAAPAVVEAAAPVAAAEPAPAPVRQTLGGKHIVVSISDQWLYAYEGDALVFDAPVSTGRDGFNTPTGTFSVYAKLPKQTMSGTLGGEYYNVPNVPSVMYINGGVALHGTYWHNLFGSGVRMSHGCINLPLGAAAWLYGWAPMGTTVQVVS